MDPIVINLREEAGIDRKGEPVRLGIPFSKGTLLPSQNALYLVQISSSEGLPFQHTVTSRWQDGSVRWLLLSFPANLAARQTEILTLQTTAPEINQPLPTLEINRLPDGRLSVLTGLATFQFTPGKVPWSQAALDSRPATGSNHTLSCRDLNSESCDIEIEEDWHVISQGQIAAGLELSGYWLTPTGKRLARFTCRLDLYAGSHNAKLEVCIHNPERAHHSGGLWDLGDPGSILFQSLGLEIAIENGERGWVQPEANSPRQEISEPPSFKVYQDSSGGEAWDSQNHIDACGNLIPRFRGYTLSGPEIQESYGLRAQPIVSLQSPGAQVKAYLQHFWQNFPSSVEAMKGSLRIGLFPADAAAPYELQGGERKSQTIWLNYGEKPDALDWARQPLCPTLPARQYQQAEAFHWFEADAPDGPLERLIHAGLDSENNFFAKREVIDEYGWRNFGDIFADHETLYQKPGESPLISHYNNQYDAIYGFARQFARNGDKRWFELMDDLSRHIKDIDIYHTDRDRAEYNNGLFWHTDHYLPAHTATHRTFSRHNNTSSTPGQTGGGPAAEHCYTTGLLYHHYLTGSESSRQAVLQLTGWMRAIHEGQGGLLEQLLAIKKQDLPKVKALLRGHSPTCHTYPFTRGTGNYLNALLDAWQLQPEADWLTLAEKVIRQSIHPADDIEKRCLLDVETGWSYLVLLSSLSRYLWLKSRDSQLDESYCYARGAFIHYTRWMLKHERLFLNDPQQLEFANDTWTAQDFRKVMLLQQAADIDPETADDYRHQADIWFTEICECLSSSSERHFSRLLVILLQNHGAHQAIVQMPEPKALKKVTSAPKLTWGSLSASMLRRISMALITFRPARERAWLNARLNKP